MYDKDFRGKYIPLLKFFDYTLFHFKISCKIKICTIIVVVKYKSKSIIKGGQVT